MTPVSLRSPFHKRRMCFYRMVRLLPYYCAPKRADLAVFGEAPKSAVPPAIVAAAAALARWLAAVAATAGDASVAGAAAGGAAGNAAGADGALGIKNDIHA